MHPRSCRGNVSYRSREEGEAVARWHVRTGTGPAVLPDAWRGAAYALGETQTIRSTCRLIVHRCAACGDWHVEPWIALLARNEGPGVGHLMVEPP